MTDPAIVPDFRDKAMLITGASRGLGRRAAEAFAAAGAQLLLSGRDGAALESLAAALPSEARTLLHVGDLRQPGQISALVARGIEHFGQIDIVLHALGGGFGMRDPLLSYDQFTELHQLNLGVAAEINRLVVPAMTKRGAGRIILVGSLASVEANGSVGYNTVKAALAAYTRSLGRELASSGVIVTCLLPGMFFAEGNSMRRLQQRLPEVVDRIAADRLPRGRVGDIEELLPLLFLLAGPGATMMSGSCVPVDGGEGVAYAV